MKINQFAIAPTTLADEKAELLGIQFINQSDLQLTPHRLLHRLLQQSFPEVMSTEAADSKIANLLAADQLDALSLTQTSYDIKPLHILNLILQLLGFEAGREFELDAPAKIPSKVNLPKFRHETLTNDDLLHAWYQLLITHTTTGQTFLDQLAGRGYFQRRKSLPKPLFFNGKAQPVFDTTQLIHEVVYVESPQDTDHDGLRDLLKVEITRPVESNQQPVPVLYTASPYNQGTNDEAGDALTHDVNVPLTEKKPTSSTHSDNQPSSEKLPDPRVVNAQTTQADEAFGNTFDYSLNDYFLARGFAVVYAAGIGTKESDGLRTTGDPEETTSTIAVIEWLNGKRTAFTNRTANIAIEASWSNRHVAMTGRSYLGTLATAAATTGVAGLKTIICEAGISSWYDYYRENGLVIAPGGFPGEDADVLAEETFSREQQAGDYSRIKTKWQQQLATIGEEQGRDTGDYNDFWDARNYRKNANNIKADVMIVHGLNDWNVKPRHAEKLWRAISQLPISRKLILHQGPHIYINNFRSLDYTDMVNLWLSHELYDLDNYAEKILPDVLVQDNVSAENWQAYPDWGAPDNQVAHYHLTPSGLSTESASQTSVTFNDHLEQSLFQRYAKDNAQWQRDLVKQSSPLDGHRQIFQAPVQTDELVIDGCPTLHLNVSSDQSVGLISAELVDLGEFKRLNPLPTTLARQAMAVGYHFRKEDLREYELAKKESPYQLISKAHMNLQNRKTLTHVETITPGKVYPISLELQPTHYRLTAGHQLGLIVYATDFGMTVRGNQNITYTLSLANSWLELPRL
ncbi:Xaa-Pro dipeptidyl-peptidase [Lactobacillus sp. LC28-10]|uniref:Xaa-Pro dipeptidyl-peptidase n=1 Tax=Secundilactobacillus angelensis TaxID=2722706 RepID=A0ABX1L0Q6_9LACO|nr:Xaa-Pro dipeptidyl-peptidase [Secundilactobacillus angelensis]MCH5462306.1 Xaa-Pro dipeptidyl-peptidase [Secundilactobacillus angelensis]NLR19045.1 Xaa-Pro dipeptidyl-peptidase [Secundilactobacillus angelensis]